VVVVLRIDPAGAAARTRTAVASAAMSRKPRCS